MDESTYGEEALWLKVVCLRACIFITKWVLSPEAIRLSIGNEGVLFRKNDRWWCNNFFTDETWEMPEDFTEMERNLLKMFDSRWCNEHQHEAPTLEEIQKCMESEESMIVKNKKKCENF